MPYTIKRLDLNALPSSPTADKQCVLPDFSVAYIIFDSTEVLYVGATKSLFNRWSALRTDGRFGKRIRRKGVKVAWIAVGVEQLCDLEFALIQFLNPKFNQLRRGKTYHHADIKRHRVVNYSRLVA